MDEKYKIENSYDTIVVGGGIAGLTATTYLARSGQKVLLIEKNKECGGLVNTMTRDGFHFDVGVRALINAGIIFTMLKDLNIKLEVVKSPVSLGIEKDIIAIKNLDSLLEYRELLKKFYPESAGEIDDVIRDLMTDYYDPMYQNKSKTYEYAFILDRVANPIRSAQMIKKWIEDHKHNARK